MKNKIRLMSIALLGLMAAILLPACNTAPRRDIIAVKSTVLGFDVSADAVSQIPHVRLGLVRNFYQMIPVAIGSSSNTLASVQTPNYATSMAADMGLTSQQGAEEFATGNAADLQSKGATTAQIGAAKLRGTALVLTGLSPAVAGAASGVITNIIPVTNTNAP
jgi:hypothetical protein